jgi:hypothetical protein
MKTVKLILSIVILSTLFTSCKKEINGSGVFIIQNRTTTSFTEVQSSGDFKVILKQDSVSKIELYGEDNILPDVETVVESGKLRIYFEDFNRNYDHNGITITISNPAFKKIDLQGSGKFTSNGIINGDGIHVKMSGSGEINLDMDVNILTSELSGSGKMYFSGTATKSDHRISGSGKIGAFSLLSDDVKASISGSGNCEVTAVNFLEAIISGSGVVTYRGQPVVTKQISGSGQVIQD